MSTQHSHARRPLHMAGHHGLLALLLLASLAMAIVVAAAILTATRPVISTVPSNATAAEQARLEFRRGEWSIGSTAPVAALDQHERHMDRAAAAEYARLIFRQGEWNAERDIAAAAEQARLEFRRGEWTGK